MYHNSEKTKNIILYICDLIMVFISYILANNIWLGLIRKQLMSNYELFDGLGFVLSSFLIVIVIFNVNKDLVKRGILEEFLYCFKINIIFAATYAIIMFIGGRINQESRGVYAITVTLNILLMWGSHLLIKNYLRKIYYKKSRVQFYIITTMDRAAKLIRDIRSSKEWTKTVSGMAIVDADMIGQEIEGIPVTANIDTMTKFVKDEVIDEVFMDVPYITGESLVTYIMEFENMGVVVHLRIEILNKFEDFNKSFSMLGNIPVITFANNYYDISKLMIKRAIDIVGALVGIVITGIITIFVAPPLLIESRGPLIFKQKRVGMNGRYFYIYKFRSMYKDAEERKKALMEKNEMKGLMFKMTDDPRITKVGKFIRKTSIDELPQFINVLKGDMSLVGTRPPTVDEFKQYETYHKRRLSMKPGLTGMWQVSGRSDIEDFEEVVKLDLQYIDNWTIGLDIRILFKTVFVVFRRGGAR